MNENYPSLKCNEVTNPNCFERSPRKVLFDYDIQSIPAYEKKEVYLKDLARIKMGP